MSRYIDDNKEEFGVEPICRALQVAPSTYYAAKVRPPSARARRDAELCPVIAEMHRDNFSVYGPRKIWRLLHREATPVGRDRVRRLMRQMQLQGAVRGKVKRTTWPGPVSDRPRDLVDRAFRAAAPNRLWVADLERHEAHSNRAVMKGHRHRPVAAGRSKLRAA